MCVCVCMYVCMYVNIYISSVQFSSVTQSCPTLCNPMNRSMPGLHVYNQLLESTQTRVHWVSDAMQPSHPLSSPSPPALNLSEHQSLFKWVSSSHQVASVLPINNQDWSPLGWTGWISLQSKGLSRVFSNTTYIFIYGPIIKLNTIHHMYIVTLVCVLRVDWRYLFLEHLKYMIQYF